MSTRAEQIHAGAMRVQVFDSQDDANPEKDYAPAAFIAHRLDEIADGVLCKIAPLCEDRRPEA